MNDREMLKAKYQDFVVPWGPIGEPVFKRTYSHTKEDGTKETWPDTVIRAVMGNILLAIRADRSRVIGLESLPEQAQLEQLVALGLIEENEIEKLVELLLPFGALPAGRHLNASGRIGRQFLFNCHSSGWDYDEPEAHFTFLFDALMQGGGVGANYSNRYLEQMPKLTTSIDLHITCQPDHPNLDEFYQLLTPLTLEDKKDHPPAYFVPDSREGWVSSVERIMRSAWTETESGEVSIVIDVSNIRPRGEPLKTSGGIACGPGPLVSMLTDFVKHLNGCVGRRLTSTDAMVLDHSLSSCVVAGGKRRSSRMSVKNWKDTDIFEFINCKREDGSHWTTNISVETDAEFDLAYTLREEHAVAVMRAIVLGSRTNGEPGFWNRHLSSVGEREPELMYCPNPCGEIGLQMWENCNLGHINMEFFASKPTSQMEEAFRLMTRWLMRATFGDIPNPRQREVVNKNRRIGVGFLGFHGFLALRGIKFSECWDNEHVLSVLKRCRERIDHEAYRYSQILGIPVPAKTTTLAPTGTLAALTGTGAGGQAIYAPWYKRLVRYSTMDPELTSKQEEGYEVFKDPDAKNTDIVVYWCEDPLVSKVRANGGDPDIIEAQDELTLLQNLRVQAMFQQHWANNSVSYTINLPADKMPTESEMEELLFAYMPFIKGTTIFPDKSRKNAPLQRITREEFESFQGRKEVTMVEVECVGGCPVK
jgi:ribonucleoside-triphosphate reductase